MRFETYGQITEIGSRYAMMERVGLRHPDELPHIGELTEWLLTIEPMNRIGDHRIDGSITVAVPVSAIEDLRRGRGKVKITLEIDEP